MDLRRCIWLGLVTSSLLVAFSGHAQTINTLDYFANGYTGVCTASNPTNVGSYYRTYQEPTNQCPGLTVYHQVKGGGAHPWSTESFYLNLGWIWQMNEVGYDASGTINAYRAFRNQINNWKGMKWLPASFSSWGQSFSPRPAVEEYWTNAQGVPVCLNTQHTPIPTSVEQSWVGVTSLPQWLQDKRSTSLNPNTWHNVEAIVRYDVWATVNREWYWYGRWQDPATGTWRPLGLVRWQHEKNVGGVWQLQNEVQLRYLVNCTTNVPCSTCPP